MTREALAADLRANAFRIGAPPTGRWIGAECELLPVSASTGAPVPIAADDGLATLPVLRRAAGLLGWVEEQGAGASPIFRVPAGGFVSYEPGGQIEFSSARAGSVPALVWQLRAVVPPLRELAGEAGIELLSAGIDPLNPIDLLPMQLTSPRYLRMAEHFARIGPAGARMMRQTASFQVNLDWEGESPRRWRLLNACAPLLTAIFANSPWYAGAATGAASFRARTWRELDPGRTGLLAGDDPVEAYLGLALGAGSMLKRSPEGEPLPFGEWVARGEASWEEWRTHLTTLFPEVRAKGFAEVRSMDAVEPEWLAAPLTLLAGLLYDPAARAAAGELLGSPDPSLLVRAAEAGLGDAEIATLARDLFQVGLRGAAVLGATFVDTASLDAADAFYDRFTRQGRAPGDDIAAPLPSPTRRSA